ncbi:unnamed protein product [Cyprideis torosa]|uniref:Uncharacterized protein n=1 Tax=Cyprideis torosa TaxID=163714 RepID=A0A7R8ZLS3_9CRUS|nr:unnamed protein product [Cyprideis torosa]CAG0892500.1 unnamed protein product [Cyprideis torosa]
MYRRVPAPASSQHQTKFGQFENKRSTKTKAMQAARDLNWTPMRELSSGGGVELEAPGGYPFQLKEGDRSSNNGDPVRKVTLASTSLEKSMLFWKDTLGMQEAKSATTSAKCLTFGPGQAQLELYQIDSPVDHSKAFGRIAFSIPRQSLPDIQCTVKERWGEAAILTPLVALDTPGKATVEVVILADPDGHEICFVGDEAFRELSQVDPAAEKLLQEAMEADKSKEWFSKKGIPKPTA